MGVHTFVSTSFWGGNTNGRLDTHALKHDSCFIVVDPATEEELGTVPEMGLKETKAAIEAAGKAFQTWGKTTAKVSPRRRGRGNTLTEPFVGLALVPTRHSHEILWVDATTPRRLGSHYRASCRMVGV